MAGVAEALPSEQVQVAENIDWLKAFPFLGVHRRRVSRRVLDGGELESHLTLPGSLCAPNVWHHCRLSSLLFFIDRTARAARFNSCWHWSAVAHCKKDRSGGLHIIDIIISILISLMTSIRLNNAACGGLISVGFSAADTTQLTSR